MKELIVITILVFISVAGTRYSFFNRKLSLGLKNIMLTGTEYILIGFLLGNLGFKIINIDVFYTFIPFLIFGLSAIGFLFGLQFSIKELKKIPKYYFFISFIQAFFTFVVVSITMYFVLSYVCYACKGLMLIVSLAIGSFASGTAQSGLAIVAQNYRFRDNGIINFLRYVSGIDGFFSLIFFLIAMSFVNKNGIINFSLIDSSLKLVLSLTIGIIPSLIFIILSKTKPSSKEYFAFLMGTILFSGGLSYQFDFPPLISGFVSGVIIANFCKHSSTAFSTIIKSEKSFYIVILVLLGSIWEAGSSHTIIIIAAYLISRGIGKVTGTNLGIVLIIKNSKNYPKTIGLGLLSEGGISVAIVTSFILIFPQYSDFLTSIIVISLFFNELFSPYLILKQYEDNNAVNINTREEIKKNL